MKIALISLLAASTTAFADPTATCKSEGTPLFVIDHQSMNKQPTSTITVFSGGGWTFTAKDGSGKSTAAKRGCLDVAARDKLAALVKGAPWTTTTKRINCRVVATTWTVDSANGKAVFEERACGKTVLDDASTKALADIHAIMDPLGK